MKDRKRELQLFEMRENGTFANVVKENGICQCCRQRKWDFANVVVKENGILPMLLLEKTGKISSWDIRQKTYININSDYRK